MIFLPSLVATLIGGIAAFHEFSGQMPAVWAVSGALSVAVAAGYGARWGSVLLSLFGVFLGSIFGLLAGALVGLAVSDQGDRTEASVAGSFAGFGFGLIGLSTLGWAIGYALGGLMLYGGAKFVVYDWLMNHGQKYF